MHAAKGRSCCILLHRGARLAEEIGCSAGERPGRHAANRIVVFWWCFSSGNVFFVCRCRAALKLQVSQQSGRLGLPYSRDGYRLSLPSLSLPLPGRFPMARYRGQETGSYAEFSRLLQHTADGNVFKKVYCTMTSIAHFSFPPGYGSLPRPTVLGAGVA